MAKRAAELQEILGATDEPDVRSNLAYEVARIARRTQVSLGLALFDAIRYVIDNNALLQDQAWLEPEVSKLLYQPDMRVSILFKPAINQRDCVVYKDNISEPKFRMITNYKSNLSISTLVLPIKPMTNPLIPH